MSPASGSLTQGWRGAPSSNNDGCVVARSAEAKALGIATSAPWFKLQARARAWGLVARSSNYELYGDMSARVMEVVGRFGIWQEVYILYPKSCCCRLSGLADGSLLSRLPFAFRRTPASKSDHPGRASLAGAGRLSRSLPRLSIPKAPSPKNSPGPCS